MFQAKAVQNPVQSKPVSLVRPKPGSHCRATPTGRSLPSSRLFRGGNGQNRTTPPRRRAVGASVLQMIDRDDEGLEAKKGPAGSTAAR